ncbi:2OG-Fe dioxygenase family protein [Tahibacter harae]|uniref:2OG-Fe dioxygenase family protein n=1 Tax=Tahibacter harae TaxID=2963937 RepID=A0ABT1QNA9_9GAMM|nr:2OG-Fe dioxygenase family protein [Tahibacter harae]MCQ4164020.1 2OG-Fe dioxygenase family protein [Tahibacter harae]
MERTDTAPSLLAAVEPDLRRVGFAFVAGDTFQAQLAACGPLQDWAEFAASWNDLAVDTYMADQGRYRRRRHAVYASDADGELRRQPHQPHYQALQYNHLHGGIARWFEPVDARWDGAGSLSTVLRYCRQLFGALAGQPRWQVEVHQFRIEARAGEAGLPTPEGVHRDGVDYVLVLLVARHNIASGTTTIHEPDGRLLGRFTLTHAFDAALVDDARVFHGVTPVQAVDTNAPAYRDVLVVTFRRLPD